MNELAPLSFDRARFFRIYQALLIAWLTGYLWNVRPDLSPNDNARWDTVWSLVEYGTYQIYDTKEEAEKWGRPQQYVTIDKVRRGERTYASKPPLLPTVIAGWVRLLKCLVGVPFSKDVVGPDGQLVRGSIHIYGKATLLFFQLLPFAIFLEIYRRFLDRYAAESFIWLYCLLAGSVGTLATGYLATLNNHTQAWLFGFFTAYLLITVWYEGESEPWRFLLIGFCSAWTTTNEFTAGLLCVLALMIGAIRDWKMTLIWMLPAQALVAGALFYTNWLAVGSVWPAYLQKSLYDYPGSYWAAGAARSGIDALNDHPEPLWLYLVHMLVGHHGLFSLTPIWIFALWGGWRNFTKQEPSLPGLALPVAAMSAVDFVAYWIFNDQRNYGGFCHGFRWLMWLGSLWLLLLPAGIRPVCDRAGGRRLAWAALTVSVFSMADTLPNPWTRSWLHRILLWFGIVSY